MDDEHAITTSSTSSTASTSSSSHPPPISVYSTSDRHAVQVIQQALNRPPSSAAQYLQQMYAAQQQHLMLQTAALQQQQHLSSTQLQSMTSVQQAGVSGDRRSASPTMTNQQSNVSQPSPILSSSPPPTQIIGRSQASSAASSSITQRTMILGSTSPTLSTSQAQMYLRAQMLIFTPTATVAAVQSDIPVISSSPSSTSCQSSSTQVQNVTLRSPPVLELSCLQSSPQQISNQDQPLAMCHNTTTTNLKADSNDTSWKGERPGSESRCTAVTCTASLHQLMSPVSYSSVQPHSLTKHPSIQQHPDPPKLPYHQMVLQQQQQLQHRHQIQATTLHNSPLESATTQHCVPIQSPAFLPLASSAHSHHSTPAPTPPPPTPTVSQSAQQSVVVSPPPAPSPCQSATIIIHPQALIQSHPPLLVQSSLPTRDNSHLVQSTLHSPSPVALPAHLSLMSGNQLGSSHQHTMVATGQPIMSPIPQSSQSPLQTLTPCTASSSNLPMSASSQLQGLPLQAISVQPEMLTPGHVLMQNALLTEEELPAAEALVQLPFQTLPPPQTVAMNLHIPPAQVESPVVYQVDNMCSEEVPGVQQDFVRVITPTPTPPTLSPPALPIGSGEELPVDHILQGLPTVVSSVSASVIKSPLDSSYASIPASPLHLPAAATRSNSTQKPSSIPGLGLENQLPQAIVKPQILTHVIEGFVIQEGLEPFPVNPSSLLVEEASKGQLPLDGQIMNITDIESDFQSPAKLPDHSTDTELEDLTAEEGAEVECEVLECEFCGKTGYPNKFLRSKRFCSQSCAKRYNASGAKRLGHHKIERSNRWSRKPEGNVGRRGRRPQSSGGSFHSHYLRQLPAIYSCSEETLEDFQEDSIPSPMTTRLRRRSEREQDLLLLQARSTPSPSPMPPDSQTEPSLWSVEDVWAFIHSLPGCHDVADEFKTQEIDGQALLLLKEDHLMSTMNIKLGPALKICARINSLKET